MMISDKESCNIMNTLKCERLYQMMRKHETIIEKLWQIMETAEGSWNIMKYDMMNTVNMVRNSK